MKRKEAPAYSWQAGVGSQTRFRPGFVPRKMCSYFESTGCCQKGDACTFAHGPEELQNGNAGGKDAPTGYWEEAVHSSEVQPDAANSAMFQATTGSGPSRFAPGFLPRKMCSYFENTGYCQKGHGCTFAHGPEELQNGNAGVQEVPADNNEEEIGKEMGDSTVDEVPVVDLLQDEQDVKLEEAVSESRFAPVFFPRRMCSFFQSHGSCQKGNECTFAHSPEELESNACVPANVYVKAEEPEFTDSHLVGPRTFEYDFRPGVLCKMWIKHPSLCTSGDACTFAHGMLEMKGDLQGHMSKLRAAGFFGSKAALSELPEPTAMEQLDTGSKGCGSKGSRWSDSYEGSEGHNAFEGFSAGFGKGRAPSNSIAVASVATAKGGKGSKRKNSTAEGAGNHFTAPSRNFSSLPPTKLCTFWLQSPDACLKGDACTFAHGLAELNPAALPMNEGVSRFLHTGFKPKVMCKNMAGRGECFKGLLCTFAHSDAEMQ